MHPVTAHGFNLGLRIQATLVARIIKAARAGQDIGSTALLADYGLEHRRDTVPLYTATNAIGWLYTANRRSHLWRDVLHCICRTASRRASRHCWRA